MFRKRERVFTPVTGKSMTKQSHRDECDIPNIIQRFRATGEVPRGRPPQYGEEVGDFHAMQLLMAEAKSQFEELSPEVQSHYGNVEGLLKSLDTPEGLAQLAEDGIITLNEPLTPGAEESPSTGDSTDSQQELEVSPPADQNPIDAPTT